MSENKYFRPASDLDVESDKYFKLADDLGEYDKTSVQVDTYFRVAPNLDDSIVNKEKSHELDLIINKEDRNKTSNIKENSIVEDYLSTIVSGKRYPFDSEMGRVVGAASTVVSLKELKRMVDEGYNIVSAEAINSNMIVVEFQQFSKNISEKQREIYARPFVDMDIDWDRISTLVEDDNGRRRGR